MNLTNLPGGCWRLTGVRCVKRLKGKRGSLLCPIRRRKEPCDGQQRNEDQDPHRKVIDHVRKTRRHQLRLKQWEKTKRKGRCQYHACDECEGNYGYHGSPPSFSYAKIARTGQGHP